MAEYIEREAVIEFIRSYRSSTDVAFHMEEHLHEIPAADVREVVLCKDCKYCLQTDEFEYWCDGFCSPARLVRNGG